MRARSLPIALIAAVACSHVAGEVSYKRSAEDDFHAGEKSIESHDYLGATKYFEHVRNKYPFSKYAAISELRLADVKFEQEHYIEAADAYAGFVRLHPTHEQVDYAAYRVGLSRWNEGPSEFFAFPPSYEKDQTQVRESVKALAEFVKAYPGSKYRPEAEKLLDKGRTRLMDHEWYAAEFYEKGKHWAGAANRFETLLKDFPGSARECEALLRLARAYVNMDERYRAQQALQQLIVKHPQDPRRAEAEKLLASLR